MLIYAGIDEAGYGPMLGPLCVGLSVFKVDDWQEGGHAPDLWEMLAGHVARRRKGAGSKVVIADSKKVKLPNNSRRRHPLELLEQGVLTFLPHDVKTDDDLFRLTGAAAGDAPWYQGDPISLPVGCDADYLRIKISSVRRAMNKAGVETAAMNCLMLPAQKFNTLTRESHSKAAVSFKLVTELIERVWALYPDLHPRIVVDRQGGRVRYAGALRHAFPGTDVEIVAETTELCRYLLKRRNSELTLTFAVDSEDRHFPVALASMLAKYVRELVMARFNRYFSAKLPDLKPTAGYVQDARRWLRDAEQVLGDIDRRILVRNC